MCSALLETENLTKKFGAQVAVDGVNLTVEDEELRALIGPNGAGKTTLFDMLTGALDPTAGEVYFQNERITDLSAEAIANKGLCRSFQITNVFDGMTILENVLVSMISKHEGNWNFYQHIRDRTGYRSEAAELLTEVGLDGKQDVKAKALSHGEQRALELGLVLALDPEMILLDEPTAGMSEAEIDEVLELIDSVSTEYTILLVEHNMDVVMNVAEKITMLHNGKVLRVGTPEEIRRDEQVQDAYLRGIQA